MRKLIVLACSFLLVLVLVFWGMFYFTLPRPKTFHTHARIKEPVQVEWDGAGIPIIQSADLQDAYFVQGYLTARDRFFQMDLTRRRMSGKLSELFGPDALESDLQSRRWNYNKAAAVALSALEPIKKEPLIAYANGVNAFLAAEQRPWEYWVLQAKPSVWLPEDTFLVVLSMYDSLNRHRETDEAAVSLLRSRLPKSVESFLTLDWGFLDSPILKDLLPFPKISVPTAKEFQVTEKQALNRFSSDDFEPGSNAWVMSGQFTASGQPLLAGDPHLDLRVPNLWYRLGIRTPSNFVFGASIPGIPGIVIGRNDQVAWTFTNSAVDNCDQILLPKNTTEVRQRVEDILVSKSSPHREAFKDSPWGPIIEETEDHWIASQWTALDPNNLKQLDLTSINQAKNTHELLQALGQWAGPPQNAVFATKEGTIGWTIVGNVPKRIGFDGKARALRQSKVRWDGFIPRKEFPLVLNPPEGFIVSANQRTLPLQPSMSRFGYHWPNAARAKRITDLLKRTKPFQAKDFFEVQLDNVSLTHLWYRDELLKCDWDKLDTKEALWIKPALEIIKGWDGKTAIRSSAYPILKAFRANLSAHLIEPIAKTISTAEGEILLKYLSQDPLVSQLIKHQPKHFLSPHFSSYCDLFQEALKASLQSLVSTPEQLTSLKWGDLNQSDIRHPFSRKLPKSLRALISMPSKPMGGDSLVPNVMTPRNGASMRLVIDFSNPTQSLFSQPGGQSGHPLSTHYSDLYSPWLEGKAVPFEASSAKYLEKFIPKRSDG